MSAKTVYRIYPSIGIARFGQSPEYFIGPEAPGQVPPPPYRDAQGKLKPQAARFRVYKFIIDEQGRESCSGEVVASDKVAIQWSVRIVNRKAAGICFPTLPEEANAPLGTALRNQGYDRDPLVMDTGVKQISGASMTALPLSGTISFQQGARSFGAAQIVLARIATDEQGRLLVIGGSGDAKAVLPGAQITVFDNNDGWCDGAGDGVVTAEIKLTDGAHSETYVADGARIVTAPPAFAPEIYNISSWWDQARSVANKKFNLGPEKKPVSFVDDIYPILLKAHRIAWTTPQSVDGHETKYHLDSRSFMDAASLSVLASNAAKDADARAAIFGFLTPPGTIAESFETLSDAPNMPLLYSGVNPANPLGLKNNGDDHYLHTSLTDLQYEQMRRWSEGDFVADWTGTPPRPRALAEIPFAEQPEALTRAALEACAGGPFFPGIETTYLMATPELYSSPYHVDPKLPLGALTEHMALPWQADFHDCGAVWWPAQRPVAVRNTPQGPWLEYIRGANRYPGMVAHWQDLGFIVKQGDAFLETERGRSLSAAPLTS